MAFAVLTKSALRKSACSDIPPSQTLDEGNYKQAIKKKLHTHGEASLVNDARAGGWLRNSCDNVSGFFGCATERKKKRPDEPLDGFPPLERTPTGRPIVRFLLSVSRMRRQPPPRIAPRERSLRNGSAINASFLRLFVSSHALGARVSKARNEMHEAVAMMNVTKIHIDEGRGGATNITPEI